MLVVHRLYIYFDPSQERAGDSSTHRDLASENVRLIPVLLINEAQETPTACLSELRLLGSVSFDSQDLPKLDDELFLKVFGRAGAR